MPKEAREWLETAQGMADQGAVNQTLIDERLEYAKIEALIAVAEELKELNRYMDSRDRHLAEVLETILKLNR